MRPLPDNVIRHNQASKLADTSTVAEGLPNDAHRPIVVPGGRTPIDHDELERLHEQGISPHEIVRRVNLEWAQKNAHRVETARAWIDGPYQQMKRDAVKRRAEAQEREARRQAWIETQFRRVDVEH